jgi:excisionase family DNA binding protein
MKKVFTTGQVAKICKVAPRTVSKWFDSGRLRGYRIPGSQDRRIPREQLPPLGLLWVGGPLIDAGHTVKLIDGEVGPLPHDRIVAAASEFRP